MVEAALDVVELVDELPFDDEVDVDDEDPEDPDDAEVLDASLDDEESLEVLLLPLEPLDSDRESVS